MTRTLLPILALLLSACAGESTPNAEAPGASPQAGLTAHQVENGIGPIRSVDLADVDPALAARGAEIFTIKCSACHKMADRYVGPALGQVTENRSPAYIMNMMLNPEEMIQSHPDARALFVQFMTPMPNQHLTEDEARAVLEYLREQASTENP